MKIIIEKNYEEMSRTAAMLFAAEIMEHETTTLGLATGSTPIGFYRELVKLYRQGKLDFSGVSTFNLDEYVGLSPEHEQSYHYFMKEQLFEHVNIRPENIHVPEGTLDLKQDAGAIYEEQIRSAGKIRIQLLGLGENGHIGFNEPADEFTKTTGKILLTNSTIEANKRFFECREDVPKEAVSMGIGTIMRAEKIVLLVNGKKKAKILKEVTEGAVTARVPGSILQFHPNVIVIADEEAGEYLTGV
ncbi:MAG: glucosamine-6-phosphate deaminase [Hespellia sp.]|nr:glucosamine-6-phosphate deaminase [Hespellia sp.]